MFALVLSLLLPNLTMASPIKSAPGPDEAPHATASMATNGEFSLELVPAVDWESAEISVAGADAVEVGAHRRGQPLLVEGTTALAAPLRVTVRAALSQEHGVTWVFTVDPDLVLPMRGPRFKKVAARRRGRFGQAKE
jgi:hypothetical protein